MRLALDLTRLREQRGQPVRADGFGQKLHQIRRRHVAADVQLHPGPFIQERHHGFSVGHLERAVAPRHLSDPDTSRLHGDGGGQILRRHTIVSDQRRALLNPEVACERQLRAGRGGAGQRGRDDFDRPAQLALLDDAGQLGMNPLWRHAGEELLEVDGG